MVSSTRIQVARQKSAYRSPHSDALGKTRADRELSKNQKLISSTHVIKINPTGR